jgi:hypothetical protein
MTVASRNREETEQRSRKQLKSRRDTERRSTGQSQMPAGAGVIRESTTGAAAEGIYTPGE